MARLGGGGENIRGRSHPRRRSGENTCMKKREKIFSVSRNSQLFALCKVRRDLTKRRAYCTCCAVWGLSSQRSYSSSFAKGVVVAPCGNSSNTRKSYLCLYCVLAIRKRRAIYKRAKCQHFTVQSARTWTFLSLGPPLTRTHLCAMGQGGGGRRRREGGGGNDPFYFLPFPLSTSACQKGNEGKGGGGGGGRARETFQSLRFLHGDDFRGPPAACAVGKGGEIQRFRKREISAIEPPFEGIFFIFCQVGYSRAVTFFGKFFFPRSTLSLSRLVSPLQKS